MDLGAGPVKVLTVLSAPALVGVLTLQIAQAQEPVTPPQPTIPSVENECQGNVEQCGLAVPISDNLVGPSNGAAGCITSRIVDVNDLERGTDFLPICSDGGGNALPDSVGEDGTPVCAPFPARRLPASWAQVLLPTGGLQMNPDPEGVTGLESWFWYDGTTTLSWPSPVAEGRTADCRILPAPAPVTYTAAISEWHYDIGDSRPATRTATDGGSEDDPAVRHTYRTKGTWTTAVTCTWRGSPPNAASLPCATRDIPVIEIRSVLTE